MTSQKSWIDGSSPFTANFMWAWGLVHTNVQNVIISESNRNEAELALGGGGESYHAATLFISSYLSP